MDKIDNLLKRGVDEVIIESHLQKRLEGGEKLRIKFGVDPTAPDIHLGHTVPLRKLKQFQELGHKIILIIGDFTATIGDPSARKEARKPLSSKEVKENMKNYLRQVGKILDLNKTEIHYNSEWFDKQSALKLFELTSKISVQRILERDDFKKRLNEDRDISMVEAIYPLLQGYDSVMIKSDLEIGGTDQKFNLLMGRRIQKRYNQKPQDIMTMWLLEGIDGIQKMSKSLGNYIAIDEEPNNMYGKIMSIPDDLIMKYFRVLTNVSDKEIDDMLKRFRMQVPEKFDGRKEKSRLAFEIVKMYHNESQARGAEKEFDRIFKSKKLPSEMPIIKLKNDNINLIDILIKSNLVSSASEAKRLIEQKAITIINVDEEVKVEEINKKIKIQDGTIIRIGPRRFLKIEI